MSNDLGFRALENAALYGEFVGKVSNEVDVLLSIPELVDWLQGIHPAVASSTLAFLAGLAIRNIKRNPADVKTAIGQMGEFGSLCPRTIIDF